MQVYEADRASTQSRAVQLLVADVYWKLKVWADIEIVGTNNYKSNEYVNIQYDSVPEHIDVIDI